MARNGELRRLRGVKSVGGDALNEISGVADEEFTRFYRESYPSAVRLAWLLTHDHEAAEHPHSHGDTRDHDHDHATGSRAGNRSLGWVGIFLGMALHTLIDGLALGASVEAKWKGSMAPPPSLGPSVGRPVAYGPCVSLTYLDG